MNTVSIETKRAAILRLQQVPGFEPGSSPSRALPVVCYCLLESTQHNELADVKSICRQACENRRRVVVCPNLSTPERIILQNGLSSISFHVSALSSGSSRLHRFPQRCRARLSQTSSQARRRTLRLQFQIPFGSGGPSKLESLANALPSSMLELTASISMWVDDTKRAAILRLWQVRWI